MRDQLVIRFENSESTDNLSWIRLTDAGDPVTVEKGSLADVVKLVNGALVIVLIPSNDVLLTRVNIPTQNKQRMFKAIPFALEEDLASDVEQLHFAIGATDAEGNTPVAVIEQSTMQQWQTLFKSAGLSVDVLIPDVLVIPFVPQSWNVVLSESTALVRLGQYNGFSCDTENLGITLPLTLKQNKKTPPEKINIWQEGEASEVLPWTSNEVVMETHRATNGLLELVNRQTLALDKVINLLQGSFSRREQMGKYLRPWSAAASLIGAWFVMQLAISIFNTSALEAQSLALKNEAQQIYKQAFPDAKKIVKPKAQMQAKLKELKGQGDVEQTTFLSLLADSGKAIKDTSEVVLRSVRYKNGTLDVELDVPNLQSLDQLKQKLASNKEMSVEIQSAASRNNKVQGRLHIKGQS